MTKKKIESAIKKIEKSKENAFYIEGLLRNYHLNLEILRFISFHNSNTPNEKMLKAKHIVAYLLKDMEQSSEMKTIITKKNLKMIQPWLQKMDVFFKTIKTKEPSNAKQLLSEGEKVFALLQMSATKMFVRN